MFCMVKPRPYIGFFFGLLICVLSTDLLSESPYSNAIDVTKKAPTPPFLLRKGPIIAPSYEEYFADHFKKSKPPEASFFGPIIKDLAAPINTLSETSNQSRLFDENIITFIPSPVEAMDRLPAPATISIVIDDLGYNRKGMEGSLALPNEVALAILPHTPFALKTATAAVLSRRIILLHAPMENKKALSLGPGGLYSNMTEEEFKTTLQEGLNAIPGITGVNNHMGSLLTEKTPQMQWVMEIIKPKGLFFLDSLTTSDSVAQKIAQEQGLKTVTRDVFLDNIPTEHAISKQFEKLLRTARKEGSAVAIGHPYPATITFLSKHLSKLRESGVVLVPIDAQLK
jgi:polysaccharide deacetylase 2 family uncharacterized protein YibQ